MKKIIILIIKIYKKTISPIIKLCGYNCKFYPTCSDYCIEAIECFGVIKGCLLSLKRILRCNPFSKGGYDPVEKEKEIK